MAAGKRNLLLSVILSALLPCSLAYAGCATPAGNAGDVVFSSLSGQMAYCNGTNWIGMGVNQPVGFGTLTTNDFCTATSGTQIACTTATINLSSQVSGTLQAAQFPALTGDVTVTAGSLATTIGTNKVTMADIAQIAGLSVIGNSGSSTGNVGAITGTANQVLVVNNAGTGLAFGSVNLAAGVTGVLGATNGGTGTGTYNTGDILYASAANALSRLAAGTNGFVLTLAGGVPTWAASTGGVTSFSAGTTGLTPATTTTGAIVLSGTLAVGNGGTGTATALTKGSVVIAGTSGVYTQDNANFFYDATNHRLGIGTATPTQALAVFGNIDAGGTNGYLTEIANATATATHLVTLTTSSPVQATNATTATTDGVVGIAVGTTAAGNMQVAVNGQATCAFDGATTAGDFVTISSTTAGDCHDAGAARPAGSQSIGRVFSTNATAGTYPVALGLGGTSAGNIPVGTITAFASTTCPSGWTEYTAARGRFLRGIDNGAGIDPSGTRVPGNLQADAFQGHTFGPQGATGYAMLLASGSGDFGSTGTWILENVTATTGSPIGDGTNGTPRTSSETRPMNVAVTYCQYQGTAIATSGVTASGATNFVARWTNATTLGTGVILDNGSVVGVGTAATGSLFNVNGGVSIGSGYVSLAAPTNGTIIQGNVGIGTATAGATLTLTGTEANTFGTDYATTGSQSDVVLGTSSSVRYTGTAAATFQGIVAGTAGQILRLHNASTVTLTLADQSTSTDGTAANKIITGTGTNLVMVANSSVMMQYDLTAARWRVIGGSGGGIPAGTTGQVQFNSANAFNASSNLFWDNTNNRLGIGSAIPTVGLDLSQKTDAIALPIGTTGTRPTCSAAVNGALRYNSTIPAVEACVNGAWVSVGAGGGQLLGSYSGATPVTNNQIVIGTSAGTAPSTWFSGTTLTLPSNTAYIIVEEWGGGAGGGGGGSSGGGASTGNAGGTSCFGTNPTACTSPTASATGGAAGVGGNINTAAQGGPGGAGGTGTGGDVNLIGQAGGGGTNGLNGVANGPGGSGGSAPLGGGGGLGAISGLVGSVGATYGGGGGGGGANNGAGSGGGAGAGGYIKKIISNPSGTYYYTIGSGGSGGAGANTGTGGAGGAGGITVTAYSSGSTQAFNVGTQATGTLGVSNGGTGDTSALTQGSVVFAGASGVYSQDNSNFFYDATNHRLGIGTTTPAAPLDVAGGIRGRSSSITFGSACSPEGMIGYDLNSIVHEPVYCDSTGKWQNAHALVLNVSGSLSSSSNASFSVSTTTANTLLSSSPTTSTITVPAAGTYDVSVNASVCNGATAGIIGSDIFINGTSVLGNDNGAFSCESTATAGVFSLSSGATIAGECFENAGRTINCQMSVVKLP
jgi:hypothetical protein